MKLTPAESLKVLAELLNSRLGITPEDCGYGEAEMQGINTPRLIAKEVDHIIKKFDLVELGQ